MASRGHALSRDELIRTLTAYTSITTADGDRTTLIDSTLKDNPYISPSGIPEKTILIMSGDARGEDKGALSFNNGTGAITLQGTGFSAAIMQGTIYRILNISSSSVAEMLATLQYYDRIFFDEDTGIAGTAWPVGTPEVPSDVIADVITMCVARNLHKINVHGALTLGATMQHYCFFGSEHEDVTDVLDLSDEDVDGCHIEGMIVTGGQGGAGFLTLVRCIANVITDFQGRMNFCSFWSGTCSFKDVGYIDLVDCESIYGVVTLQVQAPNRASIKNWRGNLILTAQDGGLCYVRGFKGTLEIDAMTAGTLNVYANGADITINDDCIGTGTINIHGNARVTDNHGADTTVNDYTIDSRIGTLLAAINRGRSVMVFPSELEHIIVIPGTGADLAFPSVTVAGLPAGITIAKVDYVLVIGGLLDTSTSENQIKVGTTDQLFVKKAATDWTAGPPTVIPCLNFKALSLQVDGSAYRGGPPVFGAIDIKGVVTVDGIYNFASRETTYSKGVEATAGTIELLDVTGIIRVWYN